MTPFDRIVERIDLWWSPTRYRIQLGLVRRCIYWSGRLGGWALVRKLDLMGYPQRDCDRVTALVRREIDAIGPSVEGYLTYQKTEIEILSERLSRRYDPGAALNEATERAIRAKGTATKCHVWDGEVVPNDFARVNEHIREGIDLRVLAEELKAKYGDKPEVADFWTQEAARQREDRAAKPEVMLELTKTQKAALEHQKSAVKRTIENA